MRVQAAALDDCWPNYKSPNLLDGQNPRTREWEVGNLKAHGGQILDRDRAVLLRFEIKGDLRCRRRLVFKPELLAALGAEPLVLLQYQRWPMCPRVYRLELLLVVEAIEAAEAAAAAAEAAAAASRQREPRPAATRRGLVATRRREPRLAATGWSDCSAEEEERGHGERGYREAD